MSKLEPSPVTDGDDDLVLVHASKNGDITAFEKLVKRHDRKLLRIAHNVTHDFDDAQEAVQEAFFKAYKRLDQFREVSQFATWLVRITLNECFMKMRRQRSDKELLAEDLQLEMDTVPADMTRWVPNPEELYSSAELREILGQALKQLTPRSRMVFVLRDIEELSINETAQVLSLSPNAVKARLCRARLQLREKLSKYFSKTGRGCELSTSATTSEAAKAMTVAL